VVTFVIVSGGGTVNVPGIDSVARIDPSSHTFDAPIHVGQAPNGIAFAGGDLWVTNHDDQTIQRIDPTTGETLATKSTQGTPTGIAAGSDGVFVATGFGSQGGGSSHVLRVNLTTSEVEPGCEVPTSAYAIAEGGGFVWVAVANEGNVLREDMTRCTEDGVDLDDGALPQVVVAAGDPLHVWVGDGVSANVYRIDASSPSLETKTFQVSGSPSGIAVGGGSAWITVRDRDEVVRLDATTGQQTDTIDVGGHGCNAPVGIALGGDGVWVGCTESARLIRIGLGPDDVVGSVHVGGSPGAVVADDRGAVWVSVRTL
jgi:streptogramin lyase